LTATWEVLLNKALLGEASDRRRLEIVANKGDHIAVRELAELLLSEWDVPLSDSRFRTPALVWSPPLDFESLPASAKEVTFSALACLRTRESSEGAGVRS
jgi:hypothetical protein